MRRMKPEGCFCLGFLPHKERRKIMERETKRDKREVFAWEVAQRERQGDWVFSEILDKREVFAWEVAQRERQGDWVFSEIYGLAHKSKRICDACINAEKYQLTSPCLAREIRLSGMPC
jgi:hypothetical protein